MNNYLLKLLQCLTTSVKVESRRVIFNYFGRWQKIRELMKIMELHQEASKSRKKKFSQTTGENLRKTIRSARGGLTHKDVYDDSGDSDSSMDQYLQLPSMDTNEKSYSLATKVQMRIF